MMHQLLPKLGLESVGTLLENLSSGLDKIYTSLLRKHSSRSGTSRELQLLILQLVTHASCPLGLLEIAEVIQSPSTQTPFTNLQDVKNVIRSACSPLLVMLPDETMPAVHHSFTEYLVDAERHDFEGVDDSFPAFNTLHAQKSLATTCITYTAYCGRNRERRNVRDHTEYQEINSNERDRLMLQHPSLTYATSNWMHHAAKYPEHDESFFETMVFCLMKSVTRSASGKKSGI